MNKLTYLAVTQKVERYAKTDYRRFGLSDKQLTVDQAITLLEAANEKCSLCSTTLKMHSWNAGDNDQFSFDRLNDDKRHKIGNLQITCLGCNIKKADDQYRPDLDNLQIYKTFINEFFYGSKRMHLISDSKKDIAWQRLHNVKAMCKKYHELTYGDRRINNWIAYKEVITYEIEPDFDYIDRWSDYIQDPIDDYEWL